MLKDLIPYITKHLPGRRYTLLVFFNVKMSQKWRIIYVGSLMSYILVNGGNMGWERGSEAVFMFS